MTFTTEELYEQAKRVIRGSLPDTTATGFVLACHSCGLAFPEGAEVGMVRQHAELAHDFDGEERLKVDLVWVGEGPPPEPRER